MAGKYKSIEVCDLTHGKHTVRVDTIKVFEGTINEQVNSSYKPFYAAYLGNEIMPGMNEMLHHSYQISREEYQRLSGIIHDSRQHPEHWYT